MLSPYRNENEINGLLKESEIALCESNRLDLNSHAHSQMDNQYILNNSSTSSSLGLG